MSLPEFWLMRNGTTESEFWLPTSMILPDGSMLKPRGIEPCVDVQPIGFNMPVDWSMPKAAIVLCPRFEA